MQEEYTGGKANEGKDGRSTKGSCEVNAVRKTPVRSSEVDRVAKREITQEVDHVTTDPLQGQPNCQPDRSRSKIGKCMDGPHKLVDSAEVAAIDVEMMKEDITTAAMYHHEGNELFAEDVEQHGCTTGGNDIYDGDNDRRCPGWRSWGTLIRRSRGFATTDMEESSHVDWKRKRFTPCSARGRV